MSISLAFAPYSTITDYSTTRRQLLLLGSSPVYRRLLSCSTFWSVPGLAGRRASTDSRHFQSRVHKMRSQQKAILPITVFYLALLFWDIIQAIGCIANLQWIQSGQIVTGDFCVAQGMSLVNFLHAAKTASR